MQKYIIHLSVILAMQFAITDLIAQPIPPTAQQMDAAEQYSVSMGGQTFVVIFQGNIIIESYQNGGNADNLQLLGSGTKGFTGMIGAIAAYDGIIKLDTPVVEVLTEWIGDSAKSKITYRHLLTMSSGLEELKDQTLWTDFLAAKVLYPAGSTFIYGPDPNLFGLALQRKLGSEKVVDYMNRKLFQPLGIRVQWQGNFADGNPQLSGGAYVRANEWYKFGEFVRLTLQDQWTGPAILPKQQMMQVIQSSQAYPAYGFYWWLKEPVADSVAIKVNLINSNIHTTQIKPILDENKIPDDFMMCRGAYGQCLYVIPSRDLVVVRNAPASSTGFYKDVEFLTRLLGTNTTSVDDIADGPELRIFPNPANDMLYINGLEGDTFNCQFYNYNGQFLSDEETSNKSISVKDLPTGFYTLIISDTKGNRYAKKLVINK
ncbi:MAG: serine hydrolase [Cyclobacteriaceae bacterium]|nr:serine hydrolase [Cyclobacteriaceae bacterium]